VSIDAAGLTELLTEGLGARLYSGAAAGVWRGGEPSIATVGTYAFDDPRELDEASLFDLASVSKTFTAAALLRLVERGAIDLDAPVAPACPVGSGTGADRITLRMLLAHTSGLPAESFLWRESPGLAPEERLETVLATALQSPPDAEYRYSCLGYIAAAALAESVTGSPWPQVLAELVLEPLGLRSVTYGPVPPERAVATEEQPWAGRGLVRGEVHDELNWYLGGTAGNAGLFGAVGDVLTFASSFLDGTLLGPETLALATTDQLSPHHGAAYGQALGPRIGDADIFGDVAAFGHPGFTGTMWLADPQSGTAAVLLTNRVHPHRDLVDLDPFRRRFTAEVVAP
jgi:CubicO group peptidase (beta-lactamase class C family)